MKLQTKLFLGMIRRSLQLIGMWFCIVTPLLEKLYYPETDLLRTLIIWLLIIYPIFFFAIGMWRQNLDYKQTLKK